MIHEEMIDMAFHTKSTKLRGPKKVLGELTLQLVTSELKIGKSLT